MADTSSMEPVDSTSFAAATAVLETAELLENILLHLPIGQILKTESVCKLWRQNVRQSVSLQRVLFFRPLGSDYVEWHAKTIPEHQGILPVGNWLYSKDQSGCCVWPIINMVVRQFMCIDWGNTTTVLHRGFVSPTFNLDSRDFIKNMDAQCGLQRRIKDHVHDIVGPRSAEKLAVFHAAEACWRRMLFMQPPCRELKFLCRTTNTFFDVGNANGVTVQDVVDGLRRHWMTDPLCCKGWKGFEDWQFQGADHIAVDKLIDRRTCSWSGWEVQKRMKEAQESAVARTTRLRLYARALEM